MYRLEKYQECFSLYRDIVKNTNDDYEDERQTNMSAVYAYLTEKEMVIIKFVLVFGNIQY